MEALAKQDNEINEDYDFWNAAPKLKTPYLKFCNAHNNRLHNVLAEYRIICEDETQTTTASVKGMILNWKSREMTLERDDLGAAVPGNSQEGILGAVD